MRSREAEMRHATGEQRGQSERDGDCCCSTPSTANGNLILPSFILAQILHALLFICLLAFTADILYQCFVVPHYFGASFFFWADIVGTLSITIDLPWLNPLASLSSEDLGTDTTVLRATRTSKLGARFGRFGKVRIRVNVCL